MTPRQPNAAEKQTQEVARLITGSIKGTRWRDLTPIEIARYLIANGVRVVDNWEST